jgi:TRAP-type uncharacterized transport system substrate-binding protein
MRKLVLNTLVSSTLILSACLAGVSAPQEAGSTIVVSSGLHGGGYWSAANRLQGVAAELGLKVEVLESRGSLQNLLRLDDTDSPVSVTFTQADALQYYLEKQSGLARQGEILEDIGQECVYVMSARGSGIRSVLDLAQKRIAIGSASSGVAVTFEYMATLAPELAETRVVYTDTQQALEQLGAASSVADAVMVVHRPKEHSAELDRVLAQPQTYQLVEIVDERFGGKKLSNGNPVYNSLELALPGAGSRGGLKTICTKGLLVSNKHKLAREQRYKLDEVLNYHWMRVYVPGS